MGNYVANRGIVVNYTKKLENLRKAWTDVKLAVRAFAREPSEMNAEKVTLACQRVKELKRLDVGLGPGVSGDNSVTQLM